MNKVLVVNNHSLHIEHANEIQHVATVLGFGDITMVDRESLVVSDTGDYGLVILSGTSGMNAFPVMGNEDELSNELALAYSRSGPILGICYGGQILLRAYGAVMAPLSEAIYQKIINVTITKEGSELIDGTTSGYQVYSSRKNYITQVPEEFIVIAESEYGPEMLAHRTKPFVAVLFHPEHTMTENHGLELVQKVFRELLSR